MIFTCHQFFLKFKSNFKTSVKTDRPSESLLWVLKVRKLFYYLLFAFGTYRSKQHPVHHYFQSLNYLKLNI